MKLAALTALVLIGACRENMPDDGPRMPGSSPLPTIAPPDREPTAVRGDRDKAAMPDGGG